MSLQQLKDLIPFLGNADEFVKQIAGPQLVDTMQAVAYHVVDSKIYPHYHVFGAIQKRLTKNGEDVNNNSANRTRDIINNAANRARELGDSIGTSLIEQVIKVIDRKSDLHRKFAQLSCAVLQCEIVYKDHNGAVTNAQTIDDAEKLLGLLSKHTINIQTSLDAVIADCGVNADTKRELENAVEKAAKNLEDRKAELTAAFDQ